MDERAISTLSAIWRELKDLNAEVKRVRKLLESADAEDEQCALGNVAITGKIVKVVSATDVVIDKGSDDGVQYESRFLVCCFGKELFDPDTNEPLGRVELVLGQGRPVQIMKQISILNVDRASGNSSLNIGVDCFVKQVS